MRSRPGRLLSLARRSGPGPPGSRGGHGGEDVFPPPCAVLKASRPDMRSGPAGLLSIAHRSGPEPPGSRGDHGGEDIAPSVCGIGILEVRRRDMRSGPVRLLRFSPAAPVLGHQGAEEVTEERTLLPSCAVLEARLHAPRSGPEGLAVTLPAAPILCRLRTRGSLGERTVHLRKVIQVVSIGATIRPAGEWSPLIRNRSGPGEGSRDAKERECCIALGLPLFGRPMKKTAEPRRRVPPSTQEALNAWRFRRIDLIVAGLLSSSRRGVVASSRRRRPYGRRRRLSLFVVALPFRRGSPDRSSSSLISTIWCRLV